MTKERKIYMVDTGDMTPEEAMALADRVRAQYKRRRYINPETGQIDLTINPLKQDEDLFIACIRDED